MAGRSRASIVAVAVALVLVLLPQADDDGVTGVDTPGGALGGTAVDIADTGTDVGDGGTTAGGTAGSGRGAGGPSVRGGGGASTTGNRSTATGSEAPAPPGYPGVGTPEALANRACDAGRGRIRFPSAWAPSCVRPWPKGTGNGGATAQGVTAETIKMVVYESPSSNRDEARFRRDYNDVIDVYNKHFELWGRRVEPVFVVAAGRDETSQRADAIRMATEIKPFLSTLGESTFTGAEIYHSELAGRGIVTWANDMPWKALQQQAPYRWSVAMDDRVKLLHATEYAGKRLAGRVARWAGDPAYTTMTRAFGLVHPDSWERSFFDAEAAKYGVSLTDAVSFVPGDATGAQERAALIVSRFKDRGVTTVVDGADLVFNVVLTREATTRQYSPEWVITGFNYADVTVLARAMDQQQWSHAFGFGSVNVLPPTPTYEPNFLYNWHHGRPTPSESVATVQSTWTMVAPMFACLMLAGPTLTVQSFRDGCFGFPPSGGTYCGAPRGCISYQGFSYGRHASFPWPDYSAEDDQADKWWDPSTVGRDELGITGPGVYRFMDGGKRRRPGEWPTSEPRAFDKEGTVTDNDAYPPPDRPPDYRACETTAQGCR